MVFKIALPNGRSWMAQLLEVFGVPSTDILMVEKNSWLKAPLFLAITKPASGEFIHPGLLKELRHATLHWQDCNAENARVYISREKAPTRAFPNERQLREQFEAAGYSSFVLEEMRVSDQIKLFVNARRISGLHGAGLVNLVWNHKNASVVEIYQAGKFNSCYSAMAAVLGHSYRNLAVTGSVSEWSPQLEEIIKAEISGA
jgi:capsular polysaccharide biosynthesis protein